MTKAKWTFAAVQDEKSPATKVGFQATSLAWQRAPVLDLWSLRMRKAASLGQVPE